MKTEQSAGMKLVYGLAVLNAVVIGSSFMFIKMTLDYSDPIDSLTFRFAAAFVILAMMAGGKLFKLNYRGKPLRLLLLLASMYPIGFFMLQTFGLEHATSAEGGILNAMTPVVTMALAAVFLREEASRLQKLSTMLSVFGVIFIFVSKGSGIEFTNLKGILLLIAACIVFAGYSVLARSISKHFSPAEISFFIIGVGFAVALLFSAAGHYSAGTLSSMVDPLGNVPFILLVVYLGIVQIVTAVMGSYVLSRIEASKSGIFINLSTVVSIVAGAAFLNETITWYHLLGSGIIIAGVIGTNLSRQRRKMADPLTVTTPLAQHTISHNRR